MRKIKNLKRAILIHMTRILILLMNKRLEAATYNDSDPNIYSAETRTPYFIQNNLIYDASMPITPLEIYPFGNVYYGQVIYSPFINNTLTMQPHQFSNTNLYPECEVNLHDHVTEHFHPDIDVSTNNSLANNSYVNPLQCFEINSKSDIPDRDVEQDPEIAPDSTENDQAGKFSIDSNPNHPFAPSTYDTSCFKYDLDSNTLNVDSNIVKSDWFRNSDKPTLISIEELQSIDIIENEKSNILFNLNLCSEMTKEICTEPSKQQEHINESVKHNNTGLNDSNYLNNNKVNLNIVSNTKTNDSELVEKLNI